MTDPLIRFAGVTKRFERHAAVNGLDLELRAERVVGLLGPNGAGKTTCLKLIMGLVRPTAGEVQVFGRDVMDCGPQIRQQIGYVPEDPVLYPWMTVREVGQFAARMYKSWDPARAEELRDELQLPRDRSIQKLSKGMRVKAALLVALAHRPRLLVLDEPMSGLDPIARDDLVECLVKARGESTEGILLSSHHIDDVTRLADEIAVMHSGRLLAHASIDDLIATTKRVETVLVDGRLPETTLPQTVWQSIDRRTWSMTLHPFNESLLETIRAGNPIVSARVVDLGVEQIFKDLIRGAAAPCTPP